jgi:hypothetical protein
MFAWFEMCLESDTGGGGRSLLQPNGEAAIFMTAPARLVFPKSL